MFLLIYFFSALKLCFSFRNAGIPADLSKLFSSRGKGFSSFGGVDET